MEYVSILLQSLLKRYLFYFDAYNSKYNVNQYNAKLKRNKMEIKYSDVPLCFI